MTIRKLILLVLFPHSFAFGQPIPGCPTGCDTVVYQSNFQVDSGKWKIVPMTTPQQAQGDRFEYGIDSVNAVRNCASCQQYAPLSAHPTNQTKFWCTTRNGCYSNGPNDSMYIFSKMDLRGLAPPIEVAIEHWTNTYAPDDLSLHIGLARVWVDPGADNARIWRTDRIRNSPLLDAAAGRADVTMGIGFGMTNVCNANGEFISSITVRGCKASCVGNTAIPTTSDWTLFALALVLLNLSLGIRMSPYPLKE